MGDGESAAERVVADIADVLYAGSRDYRSAACDVSFSDGEKALVEDPTWPRRKGVPRPVVPDGFDAEYIKYGEGANTFFHDANLGLLVNF